MKKILRLGVILAVGLIITGCSTGNDNQNIAENQKQSSEPQSVETSSYQGEKGKGESTDLVEGIETVLTSIDELKATVENAPNDVKKINKLGMEVNSNWHVIEKTVEKRNPDAYDDIEKSLYPLIAEANKDEPNIDKLSKLIGEVTDKLNQFKKKIVT